MRKYIDVVILQINIRVSIMLVGKCSFISILCNSTKWNLEQRQTRHSRLLFLPGH